MDPLDPDNLKRACLCLLAAGFAATLLVVARDTLLGTIARLWRAPRYDRNGILKDSQ